MIKKAKGKIIDHMRNNLPNDIVESLLEKMKSQNEHKNDIVSYTYEQDIYKGRHIEVLTQNTIYKRYNTSQWDTGERNIKTEEQKEKINKYNEKINNILEKLIVNAHDYAKEDLAYNKLKDFFSRKDLTKLRGNYDIELFSIHSRRVIHYVENNKKLISELRDLEKEAKDIIND